MAAYPIKPFDVDMRGTKPISKCKDPNKCGHYFCIKFDSIEGYMYFRHNELSFCHKMDLNITFKDNSSNVFTLQAIQMRPIKSELVPRQNIEDIKNVQFYDYFFQNETMNMDLLIYLYKCNDIFHIIEIIIFNYAEVSKMAKELLD